MRSILVLIPVILSAIATGQQPSLTCHTDVGVYIKVGTGPDVIKFIPKSTAITKETAVTVKAAYNNFATTTVTPVISRRTATFLFREQARSCDWSCIPTSFAGTATKTANQPHSWLLKVPASSAGNVLVVEVKSLAYYEFGVAQLDIGNNGSLEVNHRFLGYRPNRFHKTFNLGTKAVDIRIVTQANLAPRFTVETYDFQVGLTLNPDVPIKVSSYGPMCGMKLSMSGIVNGSGHTVSGKIDGGFANRGALLMLGLQPTAIPFPGTPCTILVNPLVILTFRDSNGTTPFVSYVPGRIDGVFYLQAVSAHSAYGYTSFRMSNGVKVDGGK